MPPSSIYLDNNSTTPIDPRVVEAMNRVWRDCGANPASQHALGRQARRMLEEAREGILGLLGGKTGGMEADQLIFTSGGTEANNLALLGWLSPPAGAALITSPFEHHSVRGAAELLRKQGTNVRQLPWGEELKRQVAERKSQAAPLVVSFMLANNETGAIFDLREISEACRPRGALVHTDAAQAVGKIPVHFRELGVDAMTIAPHKFHGPLGIGALIMSHGVKLQPQLLGGFQQGGLRPGTENVALAVGFHTAVQIAIGELSSRAARLQSLRDNLEQSLRGELPEIVIIGENSPRLPSTSCISFPGIDRQALVMALDLAGVACSTGSACASGSSELSPTLLAMGLAEAVIRGAIRLSVGAFNTADEVAEGTRRIIKLVKHLRLQK